MGASFVRSTYSRVSSGFPTSMTLSINASVAQFVVVEGSPYNGSSTVPVSSISDNAGNLWTFPTSYGVTSPPASYSSLFGEFIGYCVVTSALTSVTVNLGTSAQILTVCVSVYDGISTSSPFRQGAQANNVSITLPGALTDNLVVGGANTTNANVIGGLSTLMINNGVLAGYGVPGYDHDVTFTWAPAQSKPSVFAEFTAAAVNINATAKLSDSESVTAYANVSPTAHMSETEMLTAFSGVTPQVAFSAVTPDQTDSNGISLIHGLTAYHYPNSSSSSYDYWMSLQDGQLAAGLYGAARNSGLTVNQSVPTWTDSGSKTLGMVRTYNADSTSNLASFTTEADVPGATISVVVTGSNATVVVHGQFDFLVQSPSAVITLQGYLNWNGSDRSQKCIFTATSGTSRACVARTWRITAVAAGTYTAKLRADCSANSPNYVVESPHTGLTVEVIDQ